MVAQDLNQLKNQEGYCQAGGDFFPYSSATVMKYMVFPFICQVIPLNLVSFSSFCSCSVFPNPDCQWHNWQWTLNLSGWLFILLEWKLLDVVDGLYLRTQWHTHFPPPLQCVFSLRPSCYDSILPSPFSFLPSHIEKWQTWARRLRHFLCLKPSYETDMWSVEPWPKWIHEE